MNNLCMSMKKQSGDMQQVVTDDKSYIVKVHSDG